MSCRQVQKGTRVEGIWYRLGNSVLYLPVVVYRDRTTVPTPSLSFPRPLRRIWVSPGALLTVTPSDRVVMTSPSTGRNVEKGSVRPGVDVSQTELIKVSGSTGLRVRILDDLPVSSFPIILFVPESVVFWTQTWNQMITDRHCRPRVVER